MKNICAISIITLLLTIQQTYSANCTYNFDHENDKYSCSLEHVLVISETSELTINGDHIDHHTDDNVQIISIRSSVLHYLQPTIFQKFKNLEEFFIYDGDVQVITADALESCEELEIFFIDGAELTEIPSKIFQNCHELEEIRLTNCGISTLPRDAFFGVDKKLQHLDLSNNQITMLSNEALSGLIRLKMLNLAVNEIEIIEERAFNDLVEVESLLLYDNKISDESLSSVFSNLTNLIELDLHHNSITNLNPSWFESLKKLKFLSLSRNNISELPENIFKPLKNLKTIHLDDNHIIRLLTASFSQHNLTDVFTIDNNKLYSIQPDFFNNFPQLTYFHATLNDCMDDFIFNDNNPIDFNDESVRNLLNDCYYYHNPPKGVFNGNYLVILWIGLGVAAVVCVIMYILHFYFVRKSGKNKIEVIT